jgi:gliding motility-associated-like protein
VNPIPDSNFLAFNPVICIEDTLHLKINNLNQNVNYTWDFGNGTQVKQNTEFVDYIYPKSGDYTVKLVAELGNCKVRRTIEDYIHVISKPTQVDFTQNETEIDFYNPEIQFKSYTNGKYLLWNFGDGSSSTYKNPSHTFPEKPGEYIIDLTASNMENNYCSKTITRSIFMPEPVIYFIPNTFTPNGDEINNVFQPIFTYGYDPQNYSFYVYNRWGELIFESHDSKIGWDGTYGDNLAQNDTYIWKLEFKEKLKEGKHFKTGHVNMFR